MVFGELDAHSPLQDMLQREYAEICLLLILMRLSVRPLSHAATFWILGFVGMLKTLGGLWSISPDGKFHVNTIWVELMEENLSA